MTATRNEARSFIGAGAAGALSAPTLPGTSQGANPNQWLGADASGNGDWNTAADWSGNAVPAASATVTFATGNFGYTVNGDASAARIVVDGDAVTFTGQLTQSTNAGAFLTVLDLGQVTVGADAFVTGGGFDMGVGTLLDVQGTLITAGGTADTVLVDSPLAQLISSGSVQLTSLYAQSGGSFAGDLVLNDGGNITVDVASSVSGGSVTLQNSGLIYAADVPGGSGGVASFTDDVGMTTAGSYLELASDPGVTLTMNGTVSGPGFLLISGGTVELAADNAYTGGTVVQNATLVADSYGAAGGRPIFIENGGFVGNIMTVPAASVTVEELPAPRFDIVAIGTDDTVTATSGSVLLFGSQTGTLTFIGGSNSSTVVGGAGVVVATGGAGGDVIVGGSSGRDVLSTGGGANLLFGGSNGDTLIATGAGGGTLVSGGGTTTMNLVSSTGSDTLFGGAQGSQTNVLGGAGTANVILGAGAANIYGASGTLNVFAGTGALSLDFVAGQPGGGLLNVVGFDTAADHIVLTGYAPGTAAAVFAGAQVANGNTILTLTNGTEVVLFGVTNLTSGNIT